MDFKFAGEQLLRRSGVPYTIVRPGRLLDGPLHQAAQVVAQCNRQLKGAGSTRADVAAVCVLAALAARCRNCTFELNAAKPEAEADSGGAPLKATLFDALRPEWDQEQFSI